MIPFSFTTTLFGQEVDVSCDIRPGRIDPLGRDEPQYPEAQLSGILIRGYPLDLDGLYIRAFGQDKYTPIVEKLEREAVEKWEESR